MHPIQSIRSLRRLLPILSAAALLAACADVDVEETAAPAGSEPQPVVFAPYVPRTAAATATRAGITGEVSLESLRSAGFGVFAYRIDGKHLYSDSEGVTGEPNFMWNEHVTYSAAAGWHYSPLKFWPNQTGADWTGGRPDTTAVDRLTFFAYAPYVPFKTSEKTFSSSSDYSANSDYSDYSDADDYGITRLSFSGGDPLLSVDMRRPTGTNVQNVDVLFGVAPEDVTDSIKPAADSTTTDSTTTKAITTLAGGPWFDMTRQRLDGSIHFSFRHAMAAVAFGTVRGLFDAIDGIESEVLDDNTIITIKSVTLTGIKSCHTGTLNLNNKPAGSNKPNWTERSYDGAPYEYTLTAALASDVADETVRSIIADGGTLAAVNAKGTGGKFGITEKTRALDKDGTVILFLPPDLPVGVTGKVHTKVTYVVNTYDERVAGHWVSYENTLSSEADTDPDWPEPGQKLVISIAFGLTSLKVDAQTVTTWENAAKEEKLKTSSGS